MHVRQKVNSSFGFVLEFEMWLTMFQRVLLAVLSVLAYCQPAAATFWNDYNQLDGKLSKRFSEIADAENTTVSALFNKTVFEILGYTPERVASIGVYIPCDLTARAVLLNFTSMSQIQDAYPIINQTYKMSGKNYNVSVRTFLEAVCYLDSTLRTQAVETFYASGKINLSSLLNTTREHLNQQKYLTQVYPKMKTLIPELFKMYKATAKLTYLNGVLKTADLSPEHLRQLYGDLNFDNLVSKYFYASTYCDTYNAMDAAMEFGKLLRSVSSKYLLITNVWIIYPIKNFFAQCAIVNTTLFSYDSVTFINKCLNVSVDFPLQKIIRPRLLPRIGFREAAHFLNMTTSALQQFSIHDIQTKIAVQIAHRQPIGVMMKIARKLNIGLSELSVMPIRSILPKFTNITESLYYKLYGYAVPYIKSLQNVSTTISDLASANGISINAFTIARVPGVWNALSPFNKTLVKASISQGFQLIWYQSTVTQIADIFGMRTSFINSLTFVNLAKHMADLGKDELAKIYPFLGMQNLEKASISDAVVLRKMYNHSDPASLAVLVGFAAMVPSTTARLFDNLLTVASSRSTTLGDLTLQNVLSYLSFPDSELTKYRSAIGFKTDHFKSLYPIKMSVLSGLLKIPLSKFEKMSIITFSKVINNPVTVFCYQMSTTQCPPESSCLNVPSKGAVCRCKKPIQVLRNGKCVTKKVKLLKVSGMKFKQKYSEKYKDKSSNEYKNKVVELETALYDAVCKKVPLCVGIKVTAITKGSIKVEYNVIVEANADNVTQSTVQTASTEALKDPSLSLLNPDQNSTLSAQASDICQSGHDCGFNSKCILIGDGNYKCECNKSYTMIGGSCVKDDANACQTAKCPSESSCFDVPSKGAVCRCKKPIQVLRNGKCVTKKVKLFKVSGMKFNQKYSEKYKDKSSSEYKGKAVELETALNDAVCKKIPSCVGIKVTAITKGSIKVEYNVMVEANADNVTQSTVQTASNEALKDPSLSLLNPDQNSTLSAQVSDICQSGHDCGFNSKCILIGDGNYKCECNQGYTMEGGFCLKDDASKDKDIVKIVVPIVVILVVILFIMAIICVRRKEKAKSLDTYKGNQPDVGFELGKSNAGIDYNR
eukprot:gene17313-19046_t